MSITRWRWSNSGTAASTPRWISRASSTPDTTSMSTPASARARSVNSCWFAASRTALVATAVMLVAPAWLAMRCMRPSVSMPRSMASGSRCFMSSPPEPSRTGSRSRVSTSKCPSASTAATTRWNEFVPTSIAAITLTRCNARARQQLRGGSLGHGFAIRLSL